MSIVCIIVFGVVAHDSCQGSSLEQKPSEAVSATVSTALAKLLPDELSLDTFNAQYLQHHPARADTILAAAKVSQVLGAPREEVEAAVISAFNTEVEMSLKVRPLTLRLLVESL